MNQSVEKEVIIPEDGIIRFEIGVVYPGEALSPVRLHVLAKDSSGRTQDVMGFFVEREKLAWSIHEESLKGLSPGRGTVLFQVHSTEKERKNFKPLVMANLKLFSARDLPAGNVIILLFDALRADALGCYGSNDVSTPVIDKLASEGIIFEKAIAPCSWTLPSVASIFTSRLPSQHGSISYFWHLPDRSLPTLAELLSNRGVVAEASLGTWVLHPTSNYDKGFDDFYCLPMSSILWRNTEHLINNASSWLLAPRDDPFFLYLHNLDPHHPYFAPEPFSFGQRLENGFQKMKNWLVLYLRIPYIYGLSLSSVNALTEPEAQELHRRYLGEVEYLDAHVAQIENTLKETGLWENTLLIITSDHGEGFQEHGTIRHGQDLYREVISVPLIFTGGIVEGQGRRVKSPVSLLDLYPTILDFFGVQIPPDTIGQSLWPVINEGVGRDRAVFSELIEPFNHYFHLMSAVKGEYHLIKKVPLRKNLPVEKKLYRWDIDPAEQHDLSSIEAEKVRELEKEMDDFFENLPGKKSLDITFGDSIDEIQKRLKALGYIK
jgi:arylsulfatase A-like enzyme